MRTQSGRSGGIGTGRIALNPPGCKKVKREEVIDMANSLGIKLQRDGQGMWFRFDDETKTWYNLGQTNFLALEQLKYNPKPWLNKEEE